VTTSALFQWVVALAVLWIAFMATLALLILREQLAIMGGESPPQELDHSGGIP
jgi:hypothetical protein